MTETKLSNLVINKLSQKQYDDSLLNNLINPNELYLTPDIPYTAGDHVSIVDNKISVDLTGLEASIGVSQNFDQTNSTAAPTAAAIANFVEAKNYATKSFLIDNCVSLSAFQNFQIDTARTYLSIADAASTYLSIANAASTYLNKSFISTDGEGTNWYLNASPQVIEVHKNYRSDYGKGELYTKIMPATITVYDTVQTAQFTANGFSFSVSGGNVDTVKTNFRNSLGIKEIYSGTKTTTDALNTDPNLSNAIVGSIYVTIS